METSPYFNLGCSFYDTYVQCLENWWCIKCTACACKLLMFWEGVTNHWTGLLDWTSGLDYWTQNLTTKSHFPTTKIYCQSSSKYPWQLEQFFPGASGYVSIVATPRQVR